VVRYLEVAPLWRRWLALFVDATIVLWFQVLVFNVGIRPSIPPIGPPIAVWAVRYGLSLLLSQFPHFGYFLVLECATGGFTVGKRLLGIRVAEGPRPASPGACAVRDILRVVDYLPFSYAIGIISVFLDRRSRRVGDRIAGTVVIRWPIRDRPHPTPAPQTVYPNSTRIPRKTTSPSQTHNG